MMNVSFPVQVSDFPSGSPWAHLNGSCLQSFGWSDILRAAMVAGYPDLSSIPSRQFAHWRTAAFHMALRRFAGLIVQPPEWTQLDQSEKAAVSSLLGVVVTKLLVERLLNASLFLFLDVHFELTFPPGTTRIRPDFAAMTPLDEWFSVEAKGKSRFRQATLAKGKEQARALGTVNGKPVRTGIVCVTSFRNGLMEARFADPESEHGNSLAARIESMDAIRGYYNQLNRFRQFSENLGETVVANSDLRAQLWRFSDMDVDFGIIPEMEMALQEASPKRALAILRKLGESHVARPIQYLGADGIIVIPGESWQTEDV